MTLRFQWASRDVAAARRLCVQQGLQPALFVPFCGIASGRVMNPPYLLFRAAPCSRRDLFVDSCGAGLARLCAWRFPYRPLPSTAPLCRHATAVGFAFGISLHAVMDGITVCTCAPLQLAASAAVVCRVAIMCYVCPRPSSLTTLTLKHHTRSRRAHLLCVCVYGVLSLEAVPSRLFRYPDPDGAPLLTAYYCCATYCLLHATVSSTRAIVFPPSSQGAHTPHTADNAMWVALQCRAVPPVFTAV